ncbi:hypothetical protein BD324DRAFT_630987 [Kockovaella imperatae]|uniref:Enoyl reductase (ER) domain-containing protein n=1 Tax=Kockovaella imperatae TaxID=4999 RepID=A0A1Y1UDP6_9TREE|nr:hypothetical protein BD324DRAFT_630987 [Kockovaella imperatae]ORX35644.1 hypothetical protein BD324DRAFT_630987 [Kockovaella imperatae]
MTWTHVGSIRSPALSTLRLSHTSTRSYTIPLTMRAILIKDGKGPADNLYIGEEATPKPKQGEVQVKNFGLNRMDLLQREGNYPLPPQASKTILGVEFAGTVSELGDGAKAFNVGDEVFGLAYGGAYAEYIANPEQMTLPKPSNLSWEEVGGMLETWLTGYQALFLEGGMKKGANVLIHAGASGVGIAAIQLALHVGHANKVFTTCGSDEKVKFLKQLGHDDRLHVINYKTQKFAEEIKTVADGVDLIVDFVGKDYFEDNIASLNRDGTMIYLAFLSGAKVENANLANILYKRLTIKGSTLRSRDPAYQGRLLKEFKENALGLITDGKMNVLIHEVYPWDKVADAHREMQANKNSGKIVFKVT